MARINRKTQKEEDRLAWVNAKELIRNELKYLEEMTQEEIDELYPLLAE